MAGEVALASKLLNIIYRDSDRLERIDNYLHGLHDDPYMPDRADEEYKLLAKRAVSNWMPLLVGTPAQAMYVDGFTAGKTKTELDSNDFPRITSGDTSPEWEHWQNSRLDARQAAVYRGALAYGHSFTVTERNAKGKIITKGLSALRTAAIFEDAANDDTPVAALTITRYPHGTKPGTARMWDEDNEYAVTFTSLVDLKNGVRVTALKRHGATECPVTRFTAMVDLEGRTVGVIEPMIPLANRINQTVFDLLVAQTYNSFQVRTISGMVPPQAMRPVYQKDSEGKTVYDDDGRPVILDWEPIFDDQGQPVPANVNMNARRFLFAEDHETKFGSLPGTALNGYIDSIDMSIRHLAAVSQTPPHYLLGQIANLSAEALTAAETALSRKVEEFKHSFGESWERVFRLAGEIGGNVNSAEDQQGEVNWRDMENRSMAQSADALGKLGDNLGIPKRGLWPRVPGVTQRELEMWEDLADQDPEIAMAQAMAATQQQMAAAAPATGQFQKGVIPPVGKVADAAKGAPAPKNSTGNLTPK